MTDPFEFVRLTVPADGNVSDLISGLPVHYLVDSAVQGCVDDHITEQAEGLFEQLDARGRHGWHQAAAHVCQTFPANGGATGLEAAAAFRATIRPGVEAIPPVHHAMLLQAAWIENGRTAFEQLANSLSDIQLSDATRALIALTIAACGWVRDARPGATTVELFDALIPKTTGGTAA